MSRSAHAKVLRALQEGKISRVGADKDINVDVRVIAATNKDLMKEVEEKKFSWIFTTDRGYIIFTSIIKRTKEDVPLLVEKFLQDICSDYGVNCKVISDDALRYLQNYNGPATFGSSEM
jgi:transcriptional regulator with GAF, ATPase, and Fis domain